MKRFFILFLAIIVLCALIPLNAWAEGKWPQEYYQQMKGLIGSLDLFEYPDEYRTLALADLNGDDLPELLASVKGANGRAKIELYAWVDDQLKKVGVLREDLDTQREFFDSYLSKDKTLHVLTSGSEEEWEAVITEYALSPAGVLSSKSVYTSSCKREAGSQELVYRVGNTKTTEDGEAQQRLDYLKEHEMGTMLPAGMAYRLEDVKRSPSLLRLLDFGRSRSGAEAELKLGAGDYEPDQNYDDVDPWVGPGKTIQYPFGEGFLFFVDMGDSLLLYDSTKLSGDVVIPDTVNGKPVTTLYYSNYSGATAIHRCLNAPSNKVTSLTLPATLRTIQLGDEDSTTDFIGGQQLKKITFQGEGPEVFPRQCLSRMPELEELTLPSGTRELGEEALSYNPKLKRVYHTRNITTVGKGVLRDCPALNPFEDTYDRWCERYARWAYQNGVLYGTSTFTFSPNTRLTRGMFVTTLYRLAGEPAVTAETNFTDVKSGAYYAKAVAWAVEQGIVAGVSRDRFAPSTPITREQTAAMLYRCARVTGHAKAPITVGILGFSDADRVSPFAKEAMTWAVEANILEGYEDDSLRPQAQLKRSETAAMLYRAQDLLCDHPVPCDQLVDGQGMTAGGYAAQMAANLVGEWLEGMFGLYPRVLQECFFQDLRISYYQSDTHHFIVSVRLVFKVDEDAARNAGDGNWWQDGNTQPGTGRNAGYYTASRMASVGLVKGRWQEGNWETGGQITSGFREVDIPLGDQLTLRQVGELADKAQAGKLTESDFAPYAGIDRREAFGVAAYPLPYHKEIQVSQGANGGCRAILVDIIRSWEDNSYLDLAQGRKAVGEYLDGSELFCPGVEENWK